MMEDNHVSTIQLQFDKFTIECCSILGEETHKAYHSFVRSSFSSSSLRIKTTHVISPSISNWPFLDLNSYWFLISCMCNICSQKCLYFYNGQCGSS